MRHAVWSALPALILALGASETLAQDPIAVDPDHYTLEFENDAVRVLRIRYAPDEISVMHAHPETVAIPLTSGTVRMHLPDGSEADLAIEAGVPNWDDATLHQPHNIGDQSIELILVELKREAGDHESGHGAHE